MESKPKSEEQRMLEAKQLAEVSRKRRIAKEIFYPFLLKNTKSIEESKMFITAFSIGVRRAFNMKMADIKLSDLKMDEHINDDKENDRYRELATMLKDENLMATLDIVENMVQFIESCIREQNTKRPLADLPVEHAWLDAEKTTETAQANNYVA